VSGPSNWSGISTWFVVKSKKLQAAGLKSEPHHRGARLLYPRRPLAPLSAQARETVQAAERQRYRVTCPIGTVTRMTSNTREVVRNQLLIDALGGPIDLNAVDRRVQHGNPSASPVEVQNETLDAIREWVSDELFRIGAPVGKSQRFEAWHHSLDHSLHKISHDYVKHYGDPEKWMFAAGLSLTGKGELLARSLEEKDIDGYRSKAT
jgi:hypothetical protein